jgi:phosphocarrier protein FPr/phosphocarrier protein
VTLTLLAPLKGWIAPLDEVPDPVFAERMLGDGIAIDPNGSTLHAPCDAEIASVAPTAHAVTLRADNGAEILIHVGLETVALDGEGFSAHVRAGQRVKAGEPLIGFDLDLVARRAKSLITPIVISNAEAFTISWRAQDCTAEVGDPLMTLRPISVKGDAESSVGGEQHRNLSLGLPHGLHARPAGRVAAMMKPFAAEMLISLRGRTANAKSPVSLMTLGASYGDQLDLIGRGEDAGAALDAVCAFLASNGGETAAPPAPAPKAIIPSSPTKAVDGVLKGVAAAPGHAIGRAFQFPRTDIRIVETGAGVAEERAALTVALDTVRKQINASAHDATGADIMTAHLTLLDDPQLQTEADISIIQGKSAAYAWATTLDAQIALLHNLDDPRLKARASDLIDLKRQVLLALGGQAEAIGDLPADSILLADDLLPSELMALGGRILGLCTAAGGATSHVSIIAAAMNIPLVAAAGAEVLEIETGTPLILNAANATLHVDPNTDEMAAAHAFAARNDADRAANLTTANAPCRMADGVRIEVFANLAGVAEAAPAVVQGAEGCGLLRSEFLFMDRAAPPDEAEQRAAYQAIADTLDGRPLIVRTLDIGGDKPVAYLRMPKEDNPALGLRGVRTSFWRPDLLRTQLRAILKVTPVGACKIMIPMATGVHEVSAARAMLDQERRALGLTAHVELGVMIETPAAAVTAGALAEVADFFSIGTNDLTQYTLAMDRTNPAMAPEVDALHPAVLRLIALACEGARAKGRPIGVCGGLASDPLAAPLLIGLGVTELSATASIIPDLKARVRNLTMSACQRLAETALRQTSAAEVRAILTTVTERPLEAAQ